MGHDRLLLRLELRYKASRWFVARAHPVNERKIERKISCSA
jgi:hypothetical protein